MHYYRYDYENEKGIIQLCLGSVFYSAFLSDGRFENTNLHTDTLTSTCVIDLPSYHLPYAHTPSAGNHIIWNLSHLNL